MKSKGMKTHPCLLMERSRDSPTAPTACREFMNTNKRPITGLESSIGLTNVTPYSKTAWLSMKALTIAADTTQQNSLRTVGHWTEAQDKAMAKAKLLIVKQRNAAKGRYGSRDKRMMQEFHVGASPALTVKAMAVELAYMKSVAEKRIGDLTRHGFKASDMAALDTAAEELKHADSSQELSKKAQKAATEARNDAVKELQQAMQKTRSTAKSVFAGQKNILVEFESIKRAKPVKKAKKTLTVEKPARQVTTA
jgi:hypothetical protein